MSFQPEGLTGACVDNNPNRRMRRGEYVVEVVRVHLLRAMPFELPVGHHCDPCKLALCANKSNFGSPKHSAPSTGFPFGLPIIR